MDWAVFFLHDPSSLIQRWQDLFGADYAPVALVVYVVAVDSDYVAADCLVEAFFCGFDFADVYHSDSDERVYGSNENEFFFAR